MMPHGKVTLAIGEKCIYAITRQADESEYKAVSSEPANGFQPIAAANVRFESLWTVSPGSHQKWQWLWRTFNHKAT
jgi:hypothetical protein